MTNPTSAGVTEIASLKASIERFASLGEVESKPEARRVFLEFREQLTSGRVRAGEKIGTNWVVNAWVKQGILLGFRLGVLAEMRRLVFCR